MVRSQRPAMHCLTGDGVLWVCVRACVRACGLWGVEGEGAPERLKRRGCAVGWVPNSGAGWGKGRHELLGVWWR